MIEFTVGLDSNVASNEYLRCLWFLIRKQFGKLAWNFIPKRLRIKRQLLLDTLMLDLNRHYPFLYVMIKEVVYLQFHSRKFRVQV